MGAGAITIEFDARDAPLRGATPWQAVGRTLSFAFRIRGRASRREYWWWMLVQLAIFGVLGGAVPALLGGTTEQLSVSLAGPLGALPLAQWSPPLTPWEAPELVAVAALIAGLWGIITISPSFTVAIRRLHDSDLSGFWVLVALLPFGTIVLLVLLSRGSRIAGERFDC